MEETKAVKKPVIAITMGDAAGIGPELIVKVLTENEPFTIGQAVVKYVHSRNRRLRLKKH